MKAAVIYQSKTDNTKKIAERIYCELPVEDKEIVDIDENPICPKADLYYIGFPIHDGNMSHDMIDYLETLPNAGYALFASCGYPVSEAYQEKLESSLSVWLPEDGKYLGMFLCQGRIEEDRQKIMLAKLPSRERELKTLFEEATAHPDEKDLQEAGDFTEGIFSDFFMYE